MHFEDGISELAELRWQISQRRCITFAAHHHTITVLQSHMPFGFRCNKKYWYYVVGNYLMCGMSSDFSIYGLCPARDEFYLVVCEICGVLVKPQALQQHAGIIIGTIMN